MAVIKYPIIPQILLFTFPIIWLNANGILNLLVLTIGYQLLYIYTHLVSAYSILIGLHCFQCGCASSSLVGIVWHVAVRRFLWHHRNTIVIFHFPWTREPLPRDVWRLRNNS
jgi:hypothetical protein